MLSLSWSRWPLLSWFSADAELCELSNICTKQLKLMLALVKCSQHGEHLTELQLLWQPHDHSSILFINSTLTGHHCQMWDVRLRIWDFQKVLVTSCLVIWEDGAWREMPRRSPCHRVLSIVLHKYISPVSWFQTSHALGWKELQLLSWWKSQLADRHQTTSKEAPIAFLSSTVLLISSLFCCSSSMPELVFHNNKAIILVAQDKQQGQTQYILSPSSIFSFPLVHRTVGYTCTLLRN